MGSDWHHLLHFIDSHVGQPLALITLIERDGSSYRGTGARLLVNEDGDFSGSLSGGCLEAGVAKMALAVLAEGNIIIEKINTEPHFGCPGILTLQIEKIEAHSLLEEIATLVRARETFHITTSSSGTHLGLSEGFTETVEPRPRIITIGWTSDQTPLLQLAHTMNWDSIRIVKDQAIANSLKIVADETLSICPANEILTEYPADDYTAILIMSHHMVTDLSYLKQIVNQGYGYIGLLGSQKRKDRMMHGLAEEGLLGNMQWLDSFYAPVGLDLGAKHPNSIALSIIAEIQASFAKGSAGFLKDQRSGK